MSTPGETLGFDPRLCRRLRSKSMYFEAAPEGAAPNPRDGFFWCTHSMNCLGPDGRVADEESCRSGRGCFEPR